LPHTSIEIFDSHSLKEIRSSSFGFVGDVSREDFMSLASSGPIFGRFLGVAAREHKSPGPKTSAVLGPHCVKMRPHYLRTDNIRQKPQ
jgi:hypothetical protein